MKNRMTKLFSHPILQSIEKVQYMSLKLVPKSRSFDKMNNHLFLGTIYLLEIESKMSNP